jgi:hypothetical protein
MTTKNPTVNFNPNKDGRRENGMLQKAKQTPEMVNHPSHYNSGKIETIEAIEDWGFGQGFNLGNAIKYISRANHKNDCLEDLKKAKWYVEREIQRLEKNMESTPDSTDSATTRNNDTPFDCPIVTIEDYDDDIEITDVIKPRDILSPKYRLPRLDDEQIGRLNTWYKSHNESRCACAGHGAIGGGITFEITPTSIGDFVSVQCSGCKEEYLIMEG